MFPSDRANPQAPGIDNLAGRVVGVAIHDGLRYAPRHRMTHMLVVLPARKGPGKDGGAGYDVAAHISSATPAGPVGFAARLRGINQGVAR